MKRTRTEKTGVRLWEGRDKKPSVSSADKFALFLARTLSVGFLAFAWWESLLSVFPMQIERKWLYIPLFAFSALGVWIGGIRGKKKVVSQAVTVILVTPLIWKNKVLAVAVLNSLANAYLRIHDGGSAPLIYDVPATADVWLGIGTTVLTLPLLAVFSFTLNRGKGKAAVLVLLLFPVFLAAVEGHFPSVKSCIFVLFAAGIYFAISGKHSGRIVWREAVAAGGFLLILSALSWAAAEPIEENKGNEGGRYLQARAFIETKAIQRLEEVVRGHEEEQPDDNQREKDEEDTSDAVPEVPSEDSLPDTEQEDSESSGRLPNFLTETEASNLRNIASFQPGDGNGLWVESDTLPESTYYLPQEFGRGYGDSNWQMIGLDEEVYAEYSHYPENLSRLIDLCKKQNIRSMADASNFIQREFEENTIYDYNPGTTPGGWDFAEYFLFQNKKGFCVHFATTATLMYRIMGFTARYAEGYAIPVSAFEKQEDGSYRAEVTGDMGHAWCETYDNGWVIREHTLPYTGDSPEAAPPAASSEKTQKETLSGTLAVFAIIAAAVLIIFLFGLQAEVRRKRKAASNRKYAEGRGILSLYIMLWDVAEVLGTSRDDSFSDSAFEMLEVTLPEISGQDWKWIQQAVLQAMFGKQPPSREIHEKLYRLSVQAARGIRRKLSVREKIKYRYVKCLPY